jgi:hypothetical protein
MKTKIMIWILAFSLVLPLSFAQVNYINTLGRNQSIGNNNQLFIDNTNGGVGIGTSAPTRELTITSAAPDVRLYDSDAGTDQKIWSIGVNNGVLRLDLDNDADSGATPVFQINRNSAVSSGTNISFPNGMVGINTTNPQRTLQVDGSVNLSNVLYVQNNGNVGIGTTSPTVAKLNIADADTVGATMDVLFLGTGGATYGYKFRHKGGSTTPTDYLELTNHANSNIATFRADGNVGIGTTGPESKLTVNSTSGLATLIRQEDTTNGYGLAIESEGTAVTRYALTVRNLAGTRTYFHVSTERGGNIGINNSDPTQTLSIIGNVCLDDDQGTACSSRNIPMGAMEADGTISSGAFDLAERFYVANDEITAGEVVVLSATRYDSKTAASALGLNEGDLEAVASNIENIKNLEEELKIISETDSNNQRIDEIKEKIKKSLEEKDSYLGGSTGQDKLISSKSVVVDLTDKQNDQKIVGVVSSDPAFIMGSDSDLSKGKNVPVALVGRVPVKVNLENGPILAGDPLTSSTQKGYAAKSVKSGKILGYAMEDYAEKSDTEKILVLIQPGWFSYEESQVAQSSSASSNNFIQNVNGSVIIRLG